MKSAIVAALALAAPASVHAQAVPAVPDLSYATPLEGSWRYAATAGGSEAIFSNASGAPQLWVGCTRATRRVTIAKCGTQIASLHRQRADIDSAITELSQFGKTAEILWRPQRLFQPFQTNGFEFIDDAPSFGQRPRTVDVEC